MARRNGITTVIGSVVSDAGTVVGVTTNVVVETVRHVESEVQAYAKRAYVDNVQEIEEEFGTLCEKLSPCQLRIYINTFSRDVERNPNDRYAPIYLDIAKEALAMKTQAKAAK